MCPSCSSRDVKRHVRSRSSGRSIHCCRQCGLRWLAHRPSAEELAASLDSDRERYTSWVDSKRSTVLDRSYAATLTRLRGLTKGGTLLFDVGAGDGHFLSVAREAGFTPFGNELSSGAVELAREAHDIDLHHGDLSGIAGEYDVLTMWCVLAHVPDGSALLRDARRVLRSGGILYLQTPRWCAMDTVGLGAHRLTAGRFTKITDRRLALHHMELHTDRSMRALLSNTGFRPVAIEAVARYSLTTECYLESLGATSRVQRGVARVADRFVDRGYFFRNVLDVYAQAV